MSEENKAPLFLSATIYRDCPKEIEIEFVQAIEAAMDKALTPLGITRSTTTKGEKVELNYIQFGICK